MDFHFISGLPRSGSTLLASILSQNPAFKASIMSPVGMVVTKTLEGMAPNLNEAEGFLEDYQRLAMLRGLMRGYYEEHAIPGSPVRAVFDTNRRWTNNAALLDQLFPGSRIICMVREPAAIVDSFERLFRANPTYLSLVYGAIANTTVYERAVELMRPAGALGFALSALRDAYYGPHHANLLMISYEDLCRFPQAIMLELHKALGYPEFEYRFDRIEGIPGAEEFDRRLGTPGLHDLMPRVQYQERTSCLPPDIVERLPDAFWRSKEEATPAP